jgi:hypothetical protein
VKARSSTSLSVVCLGRGDLITVAASRISITHVVSFASSCCLLRVTDGHKRPRQTTCRRQAGKHRRGVRGMQLCARFATNGKTPAYNIGNHVNLQATVEGKHANTGAACSYVHDLQRSDSVCQSVCPCVYQHCGWLASATDPHHRAIVWGLRRALHMPKNAQQTKMVSMCCVLSHLIWPYKAPTQTHARTEVRCVEATFVKVCCTINGHNAWNRKGRACGPRVGKP